MNNSIYRKLGIDPLKTNVREIFLKIIQNDFPGAFVNIVRSKAFPGMVETKHPDGDGSKFIQRILDFLVNKDETVFQGAVDDALSMNTGDISASGFVFGQWSLTQIINIYNKALGDDIGLKEIVMRQIALRLAQLLNQYKEFGFEINFFGGETADLPDQVRTSVYDMDVHAIAHERDVIAGNVKPGDKIFGFASDGKAHFEEVENSGVMSNGFTQLRTFLMHSGYGRLYPFLCRQGGGFQGRFSVNDRPEILQGMTVSEAIMSPTRQWAFVIRLIIEKLRSHNLQSLLHGISMNTGGGAIKIAHVGKNILYKKTMPIPPGVFQLIKKESGDTWRNMFETFNCGVGIDVVGEDDARLQSILKEVSQDTGIRLFELGSCEESSKGNDVLLETPYGVFGDYK